MHADWNPASITRLYLKLEKLRTAHTLFAPQNVRTAAHAAFSETRLPLKGKLLGYIFILLIYLWSGFSLQGVEAFFHLVWVSCRK